MIEFGKILRTAREARGYSISQLAELTHITSSAIEDLENENFSRFPAPIYGRGFVKLYCEAVGLEAKPLVDEFMDIYNGARELNIKDRPIAGEENKITIPKTDEPERAPITESTPPSAPHAYRWVLYRWVILGAVIIAIIWGICIGVGALYRATTDNKAEAQLAPAETETPVAPRTPTKIPPLYID